MSARLFFRSWIVFSLVYLLLISNLSPSEVIAGILVGGASALLPALAAPRAETSFKFRLPWLWILFKRVPLKALKDSILVPTSLWKCLIERKRPRGALVSVPFDPGGDDPESAARRALVIAGITFAPNSIAVAIDREKRVILVHQLLGAAPESVSPPQDTEWPL